MRSHLFVFFGIGSLLVGWGQQNFITVDTEATTAKSNKALIAAAANYAKDATELTTIAARMVGAGSENGPDVDWVDDATAFAQAFYKCVLSMCGRCGSSGRNVVMDTSARTRGPALKRRRRVWHSEGVVARKYFFAIGVGRRRCLAAAAGRERHGRRRRA